MSDHSLAMALFVSAAAVVFVVGSVSPADAAEPQDAFPVPDPLPAARPLIACTPEELARLREAYKRGGADAAPLVEIVKRADANAKTPLEFPPRGGQHNQWYQCDKCQIALKTIDATHHECPKCKKVYSGEPYDDVIFSKQHYANLRRALDAAWAYAITQNPEYAAQTRGVLLGYAQRYREYPYHDNARKQGPTGGHINEQTLGEAHMMATSIAPAFDLIDNNDALPPADRERIAAGLLRPMLDNILKHKAGKSNWQSWHNAALFAGGALLNDRQLMRFTLDDPKNGFAMQMRVSVSDEGMWYENSWSYHAYTLDALTLHAEYARRVGIDVWKQEPLQRMFTLPMRYTMPDGSLPRFGDAVGASSGVTPADLEAAYHTMKDDRLLPSMTRGPTLQSVMYGRDASKRVEPAPLGSEVFPGAGHALLRSSGGAKLAAAITFGPYGGFHGHFDKLSFVLYGQGRELGVDPGRAASQAYRLPIHNNWYKATISHNAVVVNGKSQQPAEGKLLAFGATPEHAIAVAECDAAYPGVKHRRLLYVGPKYALVIDDLRAEKASTFDWVYHNRGKSIAVTLGGGASGDAQAKIGAPGELTGQEYVNWTFDGKTNEGVTVAISGDGIDTRIVVAGDETSGLRAGEGKALPLPVPQREGEKSGAGDQATHVRAGDGVGASIEDRVPLVLLRRSAERTTFAVAIEPVTPAETPSVQAVAVTRDGDVLRVKVTTSHGVDELTLRPAGVAEAQRGGKTLLNATAWRAGK